MLYGTGSNTIATTNYLTLKITENIFISDASSTEISETLYTQLINKFNTLVSANAEFQKTIALKANQTDLTNEINRAKSAEEENADAIAQNTSDIASKEELDAKVEKMLNIDGYSKDGFIVIQVINYNIDVDIVPFKNDVQDSPIQSDWSQNDSTKSDYIKNRPFYSEQSTVDYIQLYAHGIDTELGFGSYENRVGLMVGKTYSVDIESNTEEIETVECECINGAEDLEIPEATIPILIYDKFAVYDGVSFGIEGNPVVADNTVYMIADNIVRIMIHGVENVDEVIQKIPNKFLDVDNTFDANSQKPQSGKAVNHAVHSALDALTVGTEHIEDSSVTQEKLADNSINNSKIQPKSITNGLLADKTIKSGKIGDGEISDINIRKNAISNDKLANNCVKGRNLEHPQALETITVTEPVVNVCCTKVNMWDCVNIRCEVKSTSASQQVLLLTKDDFSISGASLLAKIPLDFSVTDLWHLNINITKELPSISGEAYYIGAECTVWRYDGIGIVREYHNFGRIDTGGDLSAVYFRFGDANTQEIDVGSKFIFIGTRSK